MSNFTRIQTEYCAVHTGKNWHPGGRDILAFSGVRGADWMFDGILKYLSDDTRFIATNMPGSNGTGLPLFERSKMSTGIDIHTMEAPYRRLMNDFKRSNLNIQNATIIGHSAGGFLAQMTAVREPEMVARLALISTSYGGSHTKKDIGDTFTSLFDPHQIQQNLEDFERLQTSFGAHFAQTQPAKVLDFKAMMAKSDPRADVEAIQWIQGANYNGEEVVEQISVPVLQIHGLADRLVTYRNAALAKACINSPSAHTIPLEGVGHQPHIEEEELVYTAIREFDLGKEVGIPVKKSEFSTEAFLSAAE